VIAALAIGCLSAAGVATAAPSAAPASAQTAAYGFDRPAAIAAAGGELWIANLGGNSVTEVDGRTGALIRTLAAAHYGFRAPDAIAATGHRLFVVNRHGSVTELNALTGALVRIVRGARYEFMRPAALIVDSGDVWVVNTAGDSLTEFSARNGSLVRVVHNPAANSARFDDPVALTAAGIDIWVVNHAGGSAADATAGSLTEVDAASGHAVRHLHSTGLGLEAPAGIAFDSTHLWVSDSATDNVTELGSTGQLVELVTNSSNNSNYGFDGPSVVVAKAGMVYVVSPLSQSPMVTQIQPTTAAGNWFECNTNSPSPNWFNPTGLAVLHRKIWVVSNGNDGNGQTGNALVELRPSDGNMIRHVT
jgi:hypothetical protein